MKNCIVLCSGGLDSVTTAYYVKKSLKYKNIKILFFNYGQKSLKAERKCSKFTSNKLKAEFIEVKLDFLKRISTSLINIKGKVKKIKKRDLRNSEEESRKFYVPCRNSIFLVYALSLAESLYIKNKDVYDIFVGFKNEGKESYPDTTKEFVKEINRIGKFCRKRFEIKAPLIKKDKEDIILLGEKLNIDFKQTHSCYISNKPCGYCLACKLREAGFYWAGEEAQ